jgi:hypothetical protein
MSGAWIAGSVRARLLVAERTIGPEGARELAEAATLQEALALLGRTPYRRGVRLDLGLEGAQRTVAEVTLLNVRLLAGWLPSSALGLLRALAAWFELANLEDRVSYLGGGPLRHPFELGALATAWQRAAEAQSLEELRRILRTTSWGDPDGITPEQFGAGLRLLWAHRCDVAAPEARHWAAAASALLLARELFAVGMPVDLLPLPRPPMLGRAWPEAATFEQFVAALPPQAAWALAAADTPAELWRAEGAWWRQVERDALAMVAGSAPGRRTVVGAIALLAVDAHRVAAALAAVARKGLPGVEEAFGAAA